MPQIEPDLIRRQRAVARTLARFEAKPLAWKQGLHCLALAHFHLRALGHRPEAMPRLRGAIGAQRELGKRGWASIADWLDAEGFARVPPAGMLPGDIAFRQSACGMGGLLIRLSPRKLLGWADNPETLGLCAQLDMDADQLMLAWSV